MPIIASYELLDAVATKHDGPTTTAMVARVLGITVAAAKTQLEAARKAGLVNDARDKSDGLPESERWSWHLTQAGGAEIDRMEIELGM